MGGGTVKEEGYEPSCDCKACWKARALAAEQLVAVLRKRVDQFRAIAHKALGNEEDRKRSRAEIARARAELDQFSAFIRDHGRLP